MPESHIIVRNPNEPQEAYQEEKSDAPYEAKLNSAYEDSKDEQKTVGNSRVMDLLKELEKARKERNAPDAAGEIKAPKDGGATENAGNTILCIAHNSELLAVADYITELGPGRGSMADSLLQKEIQLK